MFKSDRSDNGVTLAISGLISRPAEKFAKSAIFCHFYLYFPAAFSRTKLGQLLFRFRMRQRSRYLFFLSFSLSLSLSLTHTCSHTLGKYTILPRLYRENSYQFGQLCCTDSTFIDTVAIPRERCVSVSKWLSVSATHKIYFPQITNWVSDVRAFAGNSRTQKYTEYIFRCRKMYTRTHIYYITINDFT